MNLLDNGINIGFSVFKREASSKAEVESRLESNGWERTGNIGQRISYYENTGINLTIVEGVAGTIVMPSGPIRGRIFSNEGSIISRDNESSTADEQPTDNRRSGRTIN